MLRLLRCARQLSTSVRSLTCVWNFAHRTKPVEFYEKMLKYGDPLPNSVPVVQDGLSKRELEGMYGINSPITKIVSLEHAQRPQYVGYNVQLAIQTFQRHPDDIGSHEVQTAITTVRIIHLKEHCERNRKDHRAKRLLVVLRYRRSRMLKSLKRQSLERYFALIRDLRLSPSEIDFTVVPPGKRATVGEKDVKE